MNVDLIALGPDVVIEEAEIDKYRMGLDFFRSEFLILNTDLFILEKLYEFPFYALRNPDDWLFFRRTGISLLQTAVLRVTRLYSDAGEDKRTLVTFKTFVRRAVKSEYKGAHDEHMRNVRFELLTRKTLEKAATLRHTRIAHTLIGTDPGQNPIKFREICKMRDDLETLFQHLAFGTQVLGLPNCYDSPFLGTGEPVQRTDIESVLYAFARDRGVVDFPDRHPQIFATTRKHWSESQLVRFNKYRRKFDLTEVH